jgi:hypothetical protein
MTDAKEPLVIEYLRQEARDGSEFLYDVRGGVVCATSVVLDEFDTLTRERDAAVQACRLFVEWMDRDDSGSGVTNEERDTAQGKAQWQAWWDGNMELCGKAMDAARAVIATAQESA